MQSEVIIGKPYYSKKLSTKTYEAEITEYDQMMKMEITPETKVSKGLLAHLQKESLYFLNFKLDHQLNM